MFTQKQRQFEEISMGLHCLFALILCIYHFQYTGRDVWGVGIILAIYTFFVLSMLYFFAKKGVNPCKNWLWGYFETLVDLSLFGIMSWTQPQFFELLLPLMCIEILTSTLKDHNSAAGLFCALHYGALAMVLAIRPSLLLILIQCGLLIVFQFITNELNGMFNGILEKNSHAMAEIEFKNQLLEHSSKTDFLTDMYNHQAFYASLSNTATHHIPIALVLFDIDHFKQINDIYGHVTGDYVIREIAYLIKKSLREKDIAARYGGEEYAVLLPKTDLEMGRHIAEQIRQTIASHTFEFEGIRLNITVSGGVGVSHYMLANKQAQSNFVNEVDALLYASKRNGRNRITVIDHAKTTEDVTLIEEAYTK